MASESSTPSQNNAESIQGEKQPTNERYYPPPLPSSIEVQLPRRIEENYNATQKKQDTREKWKIVLEAFTILFIFASVIISFYMWNEMHKTAEATKVSADATQLSAEAARISADAAAASTAAWIAPNHYSHRFEEGRLVFEIGVKNVGKTPAIGMSFGAEFTFIEAIAPEKIPHYEPYQCPEKRAGAGIIPPDGQVITTLSDHAFSYAQLRLISEGKAKIFIHACAIYRDVLSDKERITEMAAIYTGRTDTPIGPFTTYGPYNRMK